MGITKLYYIDTLENGTIRLQSQLCKGRDTADFIVKNGTLMNYSKGDKGFDFYPSDIKYEIINP